MRTLKIAALLAVGIVLGWNTRAQTFVELRQDATHFNWQSTNGAPISDVVGVPPGSNGTAPGANPGPIGTPAQFQSAIFFGGGVVPNPTSLDTTKSFSANADNIDLPRAKVNGQIQLVMTSARIGSPYLSRSISFLFGAVIPVPDVDEYGKPLKDANTDINPPRPAVAPERYWLPEPYTATTHQNKGYYWSPNAQLVFAVTSGPLDITWRKADASTPVGNPSGVGTVVVGGNTFTILTKRYIVSASPVKPPRAMYWTEGDFIKTGKRVTVPTARVGALTIVYNDNFPERVTNAFPPSSVIEPVATNRLDEKRTLWFDQSLGTINAYNFEGRAFMEILGDLREDKIRRVHLGFELVDVVREPTPSPVNIELGERLTAFSGGVPDDSHLFPEPIQNPNQSFLFQHNINGTERVEYFAARKTDNLNDVQVHWLEEGLAGLKWPFRFVRYKLDWPTDVAKYSHYVRPLVSTEAEAKLTAVQLPSENAPFIQFQDPLDTVRGKLTEKFEYYSFLTPQFPAHRALIRLAAGENVRFERVLSWLDSTLRSGNFLGSVATNLSSWNPAQNVFDWPDNMVTPRSVTGTVYVGERISAPAGEAGSGFSDDYLAGHIVIDNGDSFHPGAYRDPITEGFETANLGAIIPVNAIPGDNLLDVLWFRKNQVDLAKGFKNTFWPAVIARYTIQWPPTASEIVLASNDGSGALPSLQAKGSIYYQNDATLPGYNPNEEHALMQGGQAYALRDDLNITTGSKYSSAPYVLLDYVEADGRPAMRPFKVLREKPAEGITFNYSIKAGTILQPPMPLPLLDLPFAPKLVGHSPLSLNHEIYFWTVTASTLNGNSWTLDTSESHSFRPYLAVALQDPAEVGAVPVWFLPKTVTAQSLTGIYCQQHPARLSAYSGDQPDPSSSRWRFAISDIAGLAVNDTVVVAIPEDALEWSVPIIAINSRYVEVEFDSTVGNNARTSTLLFKRDTTGATGKFNNWRLAWEPLPPAVADTSLRAFYASFTFQDRKGNVWIYRGPHDADDTGSLSMRFYYKTLPGFFFPTLALNAQPPIGTITPYLRSQQTDGSYIGDPVFGNPNNSQIADANSLSINYNPAWPDNTPVLEMAETLTTPKRGLPAVRGQTSLQVLYQQPQVTGGETNRAVVLHDPTREKSFDLAESSSTTVLGAIPGSVATSQFRGKTYFPNLPPHLAERFFMDGNRGAHGALVLAGQFIDAPLGDKYVLLNVLGEADTKALKDLCLDTDTRKGLWDAAIDGLSTPLELFVENPGKPGTFIPFPPATEPIGSSEIAEITDDDVAVDSYALTAVGPGVGYITLIAGNGRAFTPEAEPVSIQIIRVVSTLYRGEVNVVKSSNPLNEKLTMQQVVDLAGQAQDFNFEWKIAAPVDGLPPNVYVNTPRTLLTDGAWTHVVFPLPGERATTAQSVPDARLAQNVISSVIPLEVVPFASVADDNGRFVFAVTPPHRLVTGNQVVMRKQGGEEVFGTVHGSTTATQVVVEKDADQTASLAASEIVQLYERNSPDRAQSIVFRQFDVPPGNYSQVWLSLTLDGTLGAKVYVDGNLLATANLGEDDTATTTPPPGLTTLNKAYLLPPVVLSGGVPGPNNTTIHQMAVELYSEATAGARQTFNVRIEAFDSVDVTANQWIPMDPVRFEDGIRAVLGGTADVRSLSDNYVIMRYQSKDPAHASWVGDPLDSTRNIGWSQWTSPQLAEGWIKRVLEGINPFNQRVTDLFNNQVNTDVSIVAQAGPRWEGDVALNLESINDFGLIEIYETVLNRGKMLSIDGGINYGPANDALLLAAGYLNDLYMILGNEAWADAANPTIGIGTKDNTYGEIATALFAFRGQEPSLMDEELALLRGRDDFLLPGVELRPLYNRLAWNFTRGIDAGEVIYSLNYNILDQNTDGRVDAADAQKLFPQGHGDAYGHYLTALKGYYRLLLDPNFDWVPRSEAVTVLGKPVSVDYQDERKFAAAAAALARAGKQVFDLTWRRDFKSGTGNGWEHFAETKSNSTTRNVPTTRYWGMDHWASRTGQGAYLNWVVGNAILPDADPDPAHQGTIQQVDRTTVPELKELPAIEQSLQTALDNAEGALTPLGLPINTIPFDLNPLSVANGVNTSHYEQIYERAKDALRNAVVAFDDAKDVTRLMRSEGDSLADFKTDVQQQELTFNNQLVELYGSPYPDDIGPGKTYATGYTGPDLAHYMYVDNKEITFGGLLDPTSDTLWRIDLQTFPPNWLNSDGIADFSFITKARSSPVDGIADPTASYLSHTNFFVEYNLASAGFFEKPSTWLSRRATPGRIQQAISDVLKARNAAYEVFYKADAAKYDLDWAIIAFDRKKASHQKIRDIQLGLLIADRVLGAAQVAAEIVDKYLESTKDQISAISSAASHSLPTVFIAGLAAGGDLTSPARGAIESAGVTFKSVTEWSQVISFSVIKSLEYVNETTKAATEFGAVQPEEWNQELREATSEIRDKVYGMQNEFMAINAALQTLDDAERAYRGLLAEGERIQAEREVFRQRAAAVIQGFRTRDAAFRIFRNEKLERYKALFDLSAQYAFMTAQAFDYETGLLHTSQGKEFINRIIQSRSLGVIADGDPQFAGSDTGDPGLSSVMAEMNGDWSVLRGRLGIKNPDAYGTTVSLRTENYRILPGAEGEERWTDVLNAGRKANLLEDSDVRIHCMQIDPKNGLPVPGIILEFSTTIADGLNLFGKPLGPGDHSFSAAAFATKIFGVGVALEGYVGMDDPVANGSAVADSGAASPADPSLTFLDPNAMAANPYIYLIPVGVDSMRSPPLGDSSVVRTWSVADIAIPLPFNIGGSQFSSANLWQSSDSLSEPPFTIRKHQPFRPVSSANVFGTLVVYWTGGELERTQYNNTRLLGRSIWNSKWKLIIPGRTLLNDPNDGLDRFIRSVKDVKLNFSTYSYSGN